MISDYVVFLLDQALDNFEMKDMEADDPPVSAEIKLITTLDKPEDLLVYSCYIAHKLSNNEEIDDVCCARLKGVRIHTAKMVLAFLSLLS